MNKSTTIMAATTVAALLAPPCFAALPATTLNEVVVTGTRYETQEDNVPAHLTVISSHDIQSSTAQNIPDLLRSQAGIYISDLAGNKRTFRVDLRGFGETAQSNTLVLVDGRKINQPDLSGSDWSLIPLERIERIEVLRGGRGSVLYGDNASGGVINIITKSASQTAFETTVQGGSYATIKTGATGDFSSDNLSLNLAASYMTTDGYRVNSASEASDAGLTLTYKGSDLFSAQLSSGYHNDNTGLPGALTESDFASGMSRTDSNHKGDYADTEDYYVQLHPELYFANDNQLFADFSFRKRLALAHATGSWGSFVGDTEIATITFSPQIIVHQNLNKLHATINAGVDYQKATEDIQNTSTFFGTTTTSVYELEKEDIGSYLHTELAISEQLSFSAGARYDRATFSFAPSTPSESVMDKTLYTVATNYAFAPSSHLFASFSRSYRYPVLDELFDFLTNTIDTELNPQASNNFEFGGQYLFHNGLTLNCTIFRLDTKDEILYNSIAFSNINLDGKTRRDGVEISLDKSFAQLNLYANYSFINAEIRGGQFDGHDIPSVPNQKGSLGITYTLENGLLFGLSGDYVGKRPFESDFEASASDQDDYLVVNAKVAYEGDMYSVFLNLNNITNQKYADYGVLDWTGEKAYYPSPEMNAYAGISLRF